MEFADVSVPESMSDLTIKLTQFLPDTSTVDLAIKFSNSFKQQYILICIMKSPNLSWSIKFRFGDEAQQFVLIKLYNISLFAYVVISPFLT